MIKTAFRTLALFGLVVMLPACAAYPVVQVAGGAMTAYDAVIWAEGNIPADSIDPNCRYALPDKVLERRLNERLQLNAIRSARGYVFDGHAYLVGSFATRSAADHAVNVASGVDGLQVITVKFYPADHDTPGEDIRLAQAISEEFSRTGAVGTSRIRAAVVAGNAIVMGVAKTPADKLAALNVVRNTQGIAEVVDYVKITQPETAPADRKVCSANQK